MNFGVNLDVNFVVNVPNVDIVAALDYIVLIMLNSASSWITIIYMF
jgi:hypothetical protein